MNPEDKIKFDIAQLQEIYKKANIEYKDDLAFRALSNRQTRMIQGIKSEPIEVDQYNKLAKTFWDNMGNLLRIKENISKKIMDALMVWITLDILIKETDKERKLPTETIPFAMEFRYLIQIEIEKEQRFCRGK
jgi:hypothetical protein